MVLLNPIDLTELPTGRGLLLFLVYTMAKVDLAEGTELFPKRPGVQAQWAEGPICTEPHMGPHAAGHRVESQGWERGSRHKERGRDGCRMQDAGSRKQETGSCPLVRDGSDASDPTLPRCGAEAEM